MNFNYATFNPFFPFMQIFFLTTVNNTIVVVFTKFVCIPLYILYESPFMDNKLLDICCILIYYVYISRILIP